MSETASKVDLWAARHSRAAFALYGAAHELRLIARRLRMSAQEPDLAKAVEALAERTEKRRSARMAIRPEDDA